MLISLRIQGFDLCAILLSLQCSAISAQTAEIAQESVVIMGTRWKIDADLRKAIDFILESLLRHWERGGTESFVFGAPKRSRDIYCVCVWIKLESTPRHKVEGVVAEFSSVIHHIRQIPNHLDGVERGDCSKFSNYLETSAFIFEF